MNPPDKIYVSRNFSEDNSPHGLWYLDKSKHDANVEYIRKDALLEWAKEAYLNENASAIRKVCYKQLIDKLNSM